MTAMACGGGTSTVEPPPPPPPAGFRVTLVPDPEDAASAQALAWTAGIPSAEVILSPTDGSAPPRTAQSSSAGVADFGTVPGGTYYLEVYRWLSAAEAAQVPAALGVTGWATRRQVSVPTGGASTTVQVPSSSRRSLVISEWAFNPGWDPIAQMDYQYGGYLKLYNNADTTVYLDGIVVGEGFGLSYEYANWPCAVYTPIALDPAGIWSRFFQKFPGSGREYPLQPGGTVIVATDAIDHRPFFPKAVDLRIADFEFTGVADVDNPAVPNMVDIGVQTHPFGGNIFPGLAEVPFVSLPVDVATLAVQKNPGALFPTDWGRIPANRILDVVSLAPNYAGSTNAECPLLITPNFDRASSRAREAGEKPIEFEFGVQRRAAYTLPGGRKVLQHSRTGFADFIRARRSLDPGL
ncbi:MAG: DUF4876 domain-containing protein [Gemmatimonadales bacterium]